jgi:hypothetical protein
MKRAKLNLLYASGRQALRNAEARYTVQMHEHAPSYFFVGEIRCSPLMSYDCVLCSLSQEETVGHLFLACPFASLFGWLVADGWCWFVLREEYCWLVAAGCWWLIRSERKVLLAGG